MSVDLNFWKYKKGVTHDHQKIYELARYDSEMLVMKKKAGALLRFLQLFKLQDSFDNWTDRYIQYNHSMFHVKHCYLTSRRK